MLSVLRDVYLAMARPLTAPLLLPEFNLVEEYEDKLKQLNELFYNGMITFAEYDEMVEDFRDVDAIRNHIKDEKMKVFAPMIVENCKPLIQSYK